MPIQKFDVTLDITYNRAVTANSPARRGDLEQAIRPYLRGQRDDVTQMLQGGDQDIPNTTFFQRQVTLEILLDDEMNRGTPKGWPWQAICNVQPAHGERVMHYVSDPVCVSG